MNPVIASNMSVMLTPALSANVQGVSFEDVLNISVAVADAQPSGTIDAPKINTAAMDITASIPEAAPPTEVPAWLASGGVIQQPKLMAQGLAAAEEAEPVAMEESEAVAAPLPQNPLPIPVAQILASANIPIAVPTASAAPVPRKKSADIAPAAQELDAQLTPLVRRPDALSAPVATKSIMPQLPDTVPTSILEMVGDRASSFETQLSISVANGSVTSAAYSASTPVTELKQLIITQDGEWIGALARDIVGNAARDNQLTFTLIPENLGQLDVALTTDNGQVDVRLETSTTVAAQIIAADQARLIEDLRNAGLKLGQFDMSNRQNGNGQQQPQQSDRQDSENSPSHLQPKASVRAQGRFA